MPVTVKVKGGAPIKIKMPYSTKGWHLVGTQVIRTIRVDTEKGVDLNGRSFKPYKKDYADRRAKNGLNRRPNLSVTSRMLSSMANGIRATKNGVKIQMSGEQGRKAWHNEQNGRQFFGISNKSRKRILLAVKAKIAKDNQLK